MACIVTREEALAKLLPGSVIANPRAPHLEIMETATGTVWLGIESFTPDELKAFDPGTAYSRTGAAQSPMDLVGFRRSPTMTEDGLPESRNVDGRTFIQVARAGGAPNRPFGDTGPMAILIDKHQTVGFDAATTLTILCRADGVEFVQQTGGEPNAEEMNLPEGWTLRYVELDAPLTLEIHALPQTYWFPKTVSFQGPIEGLPGQGVQKEMKP